MKPRTLLFLAMLGALGAPQASSQTPPLVVETALGSRWRSTRTKELDLSWQAGFLRPRGRAAVGATAIAAFGLDVQSDRPIHSTRFGVMPRYRHPLPWSASLDLSAGPMIESLRGGPLALRASTEVSVGWAQEVALSGRVDVGSGPAAWFLGLRFGTHQITEAVEGQGIALAVWGVTRLLEAATGGR